MGDDNISGISRGDEPLRTDKDLDGILEGGEDVEALAEKIIEGIERGPEEEEDRFLPSQPSPTQQQQLINTLFLLFNQRARLEENRISPVSDATTSAGRSTAAVVAKGSRRSRFDIFYDLQTDADVINIEVSVDGSTWRPFAELNIPAGGDRDVATGDTVYTFVRAYPGSNFDDTDVNLLELVSGGN